MARTSGKVPIYLEIGKTRTFAGPLAWPGWCRSGKNEDLAIQTLLENGPRYAKIFARTTIDFTAPGDLSAFEIVERLTGNAATNFGAANIAPAYDSEEMDKAEFDRARAIIKATWKALDTAIAAAKDKDLRKGPRGGGRELDGIIEHVVGADGGYLSKIGHKVPQIDKSDLDGWLNLTRQTVMQALDAAERGEIPDSGPRGGTMWNPRYYVRRSTWHTLDHAWEIEDRIATERCIDLDSPALRTRS